MFNKIFYFLKKYKWSPLFNLKKSFDPPLDLRKGTWSPLQFSGAPLLVKNDTSLLEVFGGTYFKKSSQILLLKTFKIAL